VLAAAARALCFNVLHLPLGILYFVVCVTGLALSLGLLPLCCLGGGVAALLCLCLHAFVWMELELAAWLRSEARPSRQRAAPRAASPQSRSALRRFVDDWVTRHVLVGLLFFLCLSLPLGIVGFVLAVLASAVSAVSVGGPVTWYVCEVCRPWMCLGLVLSDAGAPTCYGLEVTSFERSLLYVPLALVLGALLLWAQCAMARFSAGLTGCLRPRPGVVAEDDVVEAPLAPAQVALV